MNNKIKKAIKNICGKVSEFAFGPASFNYSYQLKELKNMKSIIKNK